MQKQRDFKLRLRQAVVVLNEQHSLKEAQISLLKENFDDYRVEKIPASGISSVEAEKLAGKLAGKLANQSILIASPVPSLLFWLSEKNIRWGVFVSPRPQKVEDVISGEIKFVVPEEGWEILLPLS